MPVDPRAALAAKRDEVLKVLQWALGRFVKRDWYLLQEDLKEEAINHRLAVYIEEALREDSLIASFDFAVDAEYDKFGADPKSLPGGYPASEIPDEEKFTDVRPDIIVHQRGRKLGLINLLAVEVKKRKAATPGSKIRGYALWKCDGYRSCNLAYLFSAYVSFQTGPDWNAVDPVAEFFFFS